MTTRVGQDAPQSATPRRCRVQARGSASDRGLCLPSGKALLSLPVLVAFGLFSSPARAMPAASMQLFRVDGHGARALPAVAAMLEAAQAARPDGRDVATTATPPADARPQSGATVSQVSGPLLAQANEAAAGLQVLSQSFAGQLPPNLTGNIRLVTVAEDGTLGNIVEEIPFDSPNVSFSPDRTQLIVRPSTPITPGQSVMMQLPSRSLSGIRFVYPNHLVSTPCIFKATAVSALPGAGAAPAAAAAASSIPVWAIVAGVIVVGVGVAAASGAFSSGGGGGGTNPSSQ